jgi:hypothetical protein
MEGEAGGVALALGVAIGVDGADVVFGGTAGAANTGPWDADGNRMASRVEPVARGAGAWSFWLHCRELQMRSGVSVRPRRFMTGRRIIRDRR